MTDNEFIVTSSDDEEQQPITDKLTRRRTKTPVKRAYVCEHCDRIYTCRSSLTKHQGRSIKCYMERIKSVFDEI